MKVEIARRLPGGSRPTVSKGQGRRGGVPQDDARLPANASVRETFPRNRAARAFGHRRSELSAAEIKDFEDFIMWRLVELSARYELPFQIHTGHGRIQGSNPMLLVDLIEANPRTKFILFHGGFPWVGETGIILMRHGSHVWLDSVWMPTFSYSTAKRAFHEWLDVMPSSRIMWGADANHAEGIYGATEMTRRCLAEVLAEKVDRGDLAEEHALRHRPANPPRQRAGALSPTQGSALETQRRKAGATRPSIPRAVNWTQPPTHAQRKNGVTRFSIL